MSQKYTVLFENISTNVGIIYLEIWIWQMVLKFTTDPQYSFTIINHFGNTSSPIIIKEQPFFILYYCYGSNILCQNVHMVSWYMRKYGNFCSNTTAPFCPHNLFDNQFFGPPPRRFDQPVTVWSCFSPTFLSMKINLEKRAKIRSKIRWKNFFLK